MLLKISQGVFLLNNLKLIMENLSSTFMNRACWAAFYVDIRHIHATSEAVITICSDN